MQIPQCVRDGNVLVWAASGSLLVVSARIIEPLNPDAKKRRLDFSRRPFFVLPPESAYLITGRGF
jgi:hypothetical protein